MNAFDAWLVLVATLLERKIGMRMMHGGLCEQVWSSRVGRVFASRKGSLQVGIFIDTERIDAWFLSSIFRNPLHRQQRATS